MIPQSSIDLIRYETHAVHVRLAERLRDSVQLPRDAHHVNVGGRAYLRFDHGRAPLASQWYRQLRQLFLSRFDV